MKKKTSGKASDRGRQVSEMRDEYDFTRGERGKHADRVTSEAILVELDPDVAEAFPTSAEVNQALRRIIKARG